MTLHITFVVPCRYVVVIPSPPNCQQQIVYYKTMIKLKAHETNDKLVLSHSPMTNLQDLILKY